MTGELLALCALAMFSTNIVITKVASARMSVNDGFLISVGVNLAFSALLFGVELLLRREPLHWDPYGAALFLLAGAASTYLGRWFFFEAIVRLGPAKASLFQGTSPLATIVIAWLFLGETLGAIKIAAMLVAIAGLFVVSLPPGSHRLEPGAPPPPAAIPPNAGRWRAWARSGVLVAAGSAVAYAFGNVLRGAGVRQWDEPILGAVIGAIAGVALHLLFGSGHARVLRGLFKFDRLAVRLYALGGVLTISAQICMIASMKYIPVAIATLITLCTPVLVIPSSYFLLKNQEGLRGTTLAGAALTLGGIATILLT